MGLYTGGLIIGRIFASEIRGAYFREGLLSEFYGILKTRKSQSEVNNFSKDRPHSIN